MSNETEEGKGRNWTNTLLFLILMAIIAVGLGVWEARQAAKSHPVKEEKAKDDIPNAATTLCPCQKQKSAVKKAIKKKTLVHKAATVPKPDVPLVTAVPPVTPIIEKTTKKELLADVDPDFNRTKFVPDEEPQKVVVVNRTVDISAPERHHSYYPRYYGGSYYTPTYTPTIVPAPSVVTPAPSTVTPPTGHTGGNGGGSNVGLPGGHSGL